MNFDSQQKMPYEIDLDKIIINKSYEIRLLLDQNPNIDIIYKIYKKHQWILYSANIIINYIMQYILRLIAFIICHYFCFPLNSESHIIIWMIFGRVVTTRIKTGHIVDKTFWNITKKIIKTIATDYITLMLIASNFASNLLFVNTQYIIQDKCFHTIIIINLMILILYSIYKISLAIFNQKDNIVPDNAKLKFHIYKTTCGRYGVILHTPENVKERKFQFKLNILFNNDEYGSNVNGIYLNNLLHHHDEALNKIDTLEQYKNTLSKIQILMALLNLNKNTKADHEAIEHTIAEIIKLIYLCLIDPNSIDEHGSNKETVNQSKIAEIFTSVMANDPEIRNLIMAFRETIHTRIQHITIVIYKDPLNSLSKTLINN